LEVVGEDSHANCGERAAVFVTDVDHDERDYVGGKKKEGKAKSD